MVKRSNYKISKYFSWSNRKCFTCSFRAKGKTVLKNCAIEPEIKDLILFLKKLGGKIKISGRTITINESKIKKYN